MRKYDKAQRDADHAGRGMWAATLSLGCFALALGKAGSRATVRTMLTRIRDCRAKGRMTFDDETAYLSILLRNTNVDCKTFQANC
jgi:hypothetical protein